MSKGWIITIVLIAIIIIAGGIFLYYFQKEQQKKQEENNPKNQRNINQEELTRKDIQSIIDRNPSLTIDGLKEFTKAEIYKKYWIIKDCETTTMIYDPLRVTISNSTGKLTIKSIG